MQVKPLRTLILHVGNISEKILVELLSQMYNVVGTVYHILEIF